MPQPSPLARAAFYGIWFVLVPLIVAQMRVFVLAAFPDTPFVEALRGQPIPVSIVLFTVAAIVLYSQRFSLPGATSAGIGGRPGLPSGLRKRFDRARALREEARAIRRAHAREIERSLREEDRRELDSALDELARAMDGAVFDEQRFVAACDKAEDVVDARLSRWRKSETREYAESILVAVMVALAIRAFVIEAFKIPSGSMIPTLLVGDHIFVNKLAYGPLIPFTQKRVWNAMPPKRGDVIVFAFPENPEEDFIKRVIALPGDKLEVKDARVWLNDKPIPRCYVGRTSYADVPEAGPMLPGANVAQEGDLYVEFLDGQGYLTFYTLSSVTRTNAGPWFPKPGEVWVLGDNRNNSRDSREWWGQKGGGVPFENIRGRALWIWLSYTGGEGSKSDRIGSNVMGRPRLPASMKSLQPMLDKCLAPNPPLDSTGLSPSAMP
ncbi:MAG: signal peptidase I [Deltaproteobacteria bacterium]|nr:signal peptidase I [Deltaproteobacteria bacterium]